eukprot:UN03256
MWSNKHQDALSNTLNTVHDIPTEIICEIKDYVSSETEHYCLTYVRLPTEKYYKKQKNLLQKRLCTAWYYSNLQTISTITFAIFGKNVLIANSLLLSFRENQFLPALQQSYFVSEKDGIRRTIFLNKCQITVHLQTTDCFRYITKIEGFVIYLILLDQPDFIDKVNQLCTFNWTKHRSMNNCILI